MDGGRAAGELIGLWSRALHIVRALGAFRPPRPLECSVRRNRLKSRFLLKFSFAVCTLACAAVLRAQQRPERSPQQPSQHAAQRFSAPLSQQLRQPLLRRMHHTVWTRSQDVELAPIGSLVQSADGYLWFSSRGSLLRFDGLRFTRVDSLTSPVLQVDSSDVARPLFVDRNGVMWLRRSDGALIHYRNGSFTLGVPPIATRRSIATAFEDGAGQVWVEIGATVYRVEGDKIVRATLPAGVPTTNITAIIPDNDRGIWIGTKSEGLWHVSDGRAERVAEPPLRMQGVLPVRHARDGKLWVWGPRSLTVLHDGQWSPVLFNGSEIAPSRLVEDANGQMWICTQNAGMLQPHGERIEQFSKRHGLTDVSVRDAMIDREKNLWILTSGGIERFRTAPFTTLDESDNVPFEQSLGLFADGDRGLWVRSTDSRVHHVRGGFVSGDTGEIQWSEFTAPQQAKGTPTLVTRNGDLVLWSSGFGIQRLRNGLPSTVTTLALGATVVRAVHEDAFGSLWLGYNTREPTPGLARWTNNSLKFVALEGTGKPGNASTIAEDAEGSLWVNNTAMPVIYKLRNDSVIARIDSSDGMPAVATTIVVEGIDSLWMLTNRSHLVRMVGGKATRVHFAHENPVLSPTWSTMIRHGNSLWIATGAGVARLDMTALHAAADGRTPVAPSRIYGTVDGLPNARSTYTATGVAAVAHDGRMWLSTSGGLAVHDERFDTPNTVPPLVHVEEVVVDGRVGNGAIPPHPDRVDIHFTAIALRAPSNARIEYMLEGADRNWVPATTDRVATYTQLRAGNYTFRVRAWNEDGVTGTTEGSLALRVVPMWYETTLFRTFAILAMMAAGPMLVYLVLQERARRKEADLRARFDATLDERTRIARELHDTLLQGFSGITLQLHTVANAVTASPEKTNERLNKILTLADHTLADARQMIWDLRAPELEHQELTTALATAARDAIVDAPIRLTFNVHGDARRLPPLVEATALRVGREAATNAVRHAQPSLIEIELAYSDTRLDLRVRDDGQGFCEPAASDSGANRHWGITGMRERAARAGGSVDIRSDSGSGTTVSLLLPIGKA
jgi:signal transduction histidine kinase/ligand-binding sensor domain-containing protein